MRRWIDRCRLRLRTLLMRDRVERELERELQFHVAHQAEEYMAAGMSPDAARDAALRTFGPTARIEEECRDARRTSSIEQMARDLAYAVRVFRQSPTFTAAAILTLTLGFGANAAILGVVHGVLFRPLPFPQPERLVMLRETIGDVPVRASAPDYLDWRRQSRSYAKMGARTEAFVALSEGTAAEPERIDATRASASYFDTLDVRPLLGRLFTEADDRLGAERVVVLGEALWHRRFGGRREVIGRVVRLDAILHTVVGVLPASAALTEDADRVYVPLTLTNEEREATGMRLLEVIARLEPGVSMTAAQHELAAIMKSLEHVRPGSNTRVSGLVTPLAPTLVRDVRLSLSLLWGAVGLVLLVACANVANLHLSRNAARRKELALRLSLGATRGRIVRQLLAEHLALGLAGAAAGAGLGFVLFDFLVQALPPDTPRIAQAKLDLTIFLLTLGMGAVTSVVFGLVPALQLSRPSLQDSLKEGARTLAVPSKSVFGSSLVVGEIAVSIVLLVGAGLLVRSFLQLQNVSPGFETEGILTARLSLPAQRYQSDAAVVRFYDTLLERLQGVPGVISAAAITQLPLDQPGASMTTLIEGRPRPRHGDWANWPVFFDRGVTPDYRRTLGLRLLDGRDLTAADAAGRRRVALINQAAARRYWPNERAVGARIQPDDGDDRPVEIVGVISDTLHMGLNQEPQPEFYLPISQVSSMVWTVTDRSLTVIVRTAGDNAARLSTPVRTIVRQLDPELPVYAVRELDEIVARSTSSARTFTTLLVTFGAIALALAAVGMYGLVAFLVQQRHHEFGVRLALGCTGAGIRRLVVSRGMVLGTIGVTIGTAGALAGSRLLRSLLFQVSVTDPYVLAGVATLLLVVTAGACWIPARRAARVNPVALLRSA